MYTMANRYFAIALLVISSFISIISFKVVPSRWSTTLTREKMTLSMADREIVIVGAAGGVAETIFSRAQASSSLVTGVFDTQPMKARSSKSSKIYFGTDVESMLSLKNKIVVLVAEKGEEDKASPSEQVIAKVAKLITKESAPTSVVVATSVASMDSGTGGVMAIFGMGEAVSTSVASIRSVGTSEGSSFPVSVLMYGDLLGQPDVPFLSALLLEPELHPSYVLQSVLFTSKASNQYVKTEPCTPSALSEAVFRLVNKQLQHLQDPAKARSAIPTVESEVVVCSIAGPPPAEKDWDNLFQRVLNAYSPDSEVLRLEFGQVVKKQLFLKWIANTWFPQAIIEADAATILSGARPVRASVQGDNVVRVQWEDMDMQAMRPKPVGALELEVVESADGSASLVVRRRLVEASKAGLPGEALLMDKLVEGINKIAYKKQFVTEKASK